MVVLALDPDGVQGEDSELERSWISLAGRH